MRNLTSGIKIRHTLGEHDSLKEAHKLLGITNQLVQKMEQVFNQWAQIKITDRPVKKLVQIAMAPNRETWRNLQTGKKDEFSSVFNNMVENVLEYSHTCPTQQRETAKETLFGAYNVVTGYFQNVKGYRNKETKFKSIMWGNALGEGKS